MNTNPQTNRSSQPATHRGVGQYGGNHESNTGYQSYGEMDPNSATTSSKDESVLKLERDIAIQEFKDDRDFIIETLKQNIKNHEFTEAQQLIQQYRAALKVDETFAMLAKMVKDGIEKDKKIEKFETMLDVTPADEYTKRIEICKNILRIDSEHQVSKKEIERCEAALGISTNQSQNNNKSKDTSSNDILACPKTAITLIILDALIILGTIGDGNPSAIVYYLLAIGLHFVICSNIKANPLKKIPNGAKIALSILLFFMGAAFL